MNTDNTRDAAEPSPASAGSRGKVTVSFHTDDSACAFPDIRPIRRQRFTLTDEEREAIWAVAEAYAENDGDPECERIASIMQGLWHRTK
jgi:hypothetical protein